MSSLSESDDELQSLVKVPSGSTLTPSKPEKETDWTKIRITHRSDGTPFVGVDITKTLKEKLDKVGRSRGPQSLFVKLDKIFKNSKDIFVKGRSLSKVTELEKQSILKSYNDIVSEINRDKIILKTEDYGNLRAIGNRIKALNLPLTVIPDIPSSSQVKQIESQNTLISPEKKPKQAEPSTKTPVKVKTAPVIDPTSKLEMPEVVPSYSSLFKNPENSMSSSLSSSGVELNPVLYGGFEASPQAPMSNFEQASSGFSNENRQIGPADNLDLLLRTVETQIDNVKIVDSRNSRDYANIDAEFNVIRNDFEQLNSFEKPNFRERMTTAQNNLFLIRSLVRMSQMMSQRTLNGNDIGDISDFESVNTNTINSLSLYPSYKNKLDILTNAVQRQLQGQPEGQPEPEEIVGEHPEHDQEDRDEGQEILNAFSQSSLASQPGTQRVLTFADNEEEETEDDEEEKSSQASNSFSGLGQANVNEEASTDASSQASQDASAINDSYVENVNKRANEGTKSFLEREQLKNLLIKKAKELLAKGYSKQIVFDTLRQKLSEANVPEEEIDIGLKEIDDGVTGFVNKKLNYADNIAQGIEVMTEDELRYNASTLNLVNHEVYGYIDQNVSEDFLNDKKRQRAIQRQEAKYEMLLNALDEDLEETDADVTSKANLKSTMSYILRELKNNNQIQDITLGGLQNLIKYYWNKVDEVKSAPEVKPHWERYNKNKIVNSDATLTGAGGNFGGFSLSLPFPMSSNNFILM